MLKRTWPLMILLASLIATFPAAGRPLAPPQQSPQLDFSISSANFSPSGPDHEPLQSEIYPISPGTKLSGSAAIKRVGKLGGAKLDILLQPGAKIIGSVSVPAAPAGTKQLKFVATIPKNLKPGTYNVQLSIDPKNLIKESNEKNNNHLIAKKIQVAQP
jgi:hypothetical protein